MLSANFQLLEQLVSLQSIRHEIRAFTVISYFKSYEMHTFKFCVVMSSALRDFSFDTKSTTLILDREKKFSCDGDRTRIFNKLQQFRSLQRKRLSRVRDSSVVKCMRFNKVISPLEMTTTIIRGYLD